MKVGIIGAGAIAQIHGFLIKNRPDAEIVGIADININAAKGLAADLEMECSCYEDAKTMLEEKNPDLVHVLVPPQCQPEISISAMEKGCHVLVEKPMALTVAEARNMVEAAKRNKVQLCVNQNGVQEDVVQRGLKLAFSGVIGEVVSVEAHEVYNPERSPAMVAEGAQQSHWAYKMNGGPLQDMLPHPSYLVLEFITEVKNLHCVSLNRGIVPKGLPDEIRVIIESDKITGYISVSMSERPDIETLTIKGTKGVIHADSFNNIVTVRKESRLPRMIDRGLSGYGLSVQNLRGSLANAFNFATGRIDKSGGIEIVMSRFYKSIYDGSEPPVSLDRSIRVVELINKVWPAPLGAE